MNTKRCLQYGCTEIAAPKSNRCTLHNAEFQQARKERHAKRYGAEYKAARAAWVEYFAQGGVTYCARCREKVSAFTIWHLDHVDARLSPEFKGGALHPSHSTCNTSAGGKLGKRRKKL